MIERLDTSREDVDEGTEQIRVGVADYATAADGSILSTSGLGSCIGVAVFDDGEGIAGLAHIMLPAAGDDDSNDGKYADTGIEALLAAMEAAGADRSDVTAKIAGGSSMLETSTIGEGISQRNIEAVRRILDREGIPILEEDVGGDHGRTIEVDPATGDVRVKVARGDDRVL